jgi:hypothetical protein
MITAKIVYNKCYGGFGLSDKAIRRYAELKGITIYPEGERHSIIYWTVPINERKKIWDEAQVFCHYDIERDDWALVQVVEELGDEANGECAELRIEEVPDGTAYDIDDYDGNETVNTHGPYRCARSKEWQTSLPARSASIAKGAF